MTTTPTCERYDRDRPCPKCGSGPTPSVYCAQQSPDPLIGFGLTHRNRHPWIPETGHMHRKCLHCGYERIEIALDSPELTATEREQRLAELHAEHDAWVNRIRESKAPFG